ncbi:hypothetical protein NQ318_022055 [Aromia moschata]|uniref:Integrase p58-like C-terminal domain-containing protein n=1 Tax=Aromia moschata TaxID=1265417 RepID=A0AAV8Z5Q7_9CUCU|nr:hypothetical protein NQ318_022055 [Aromia moschata]
MVVAPKRTKGKSPKLQSNWEGPYTIIKKINDLVYRIQLSPRSKPKVVHLERLAKYTGHNPPDWFVVEDPPPRTEDSSNQQIMEISIARVSGSHFTSSGVAQLTRHLSCVYLFYLQSSFLALAEPLPG